jgi:hypothetical protein
MYVVSRKRFHYDDSVVRRALEEKNDTTSLISWLDYWYTHRSGPLTVVPHEGYDLVYNYHFETDDGRRLEESNDANALYYADTKEIW